MTGDELARALSAPDTAGAVLRATVVDLAADGTVTVDLGGGRVIAGVERLEQYPPATGHVVYVTRMDASSWLVLGRRATENVTSVPVAVGWSLPWDVTAAPVPVDESGTLVVDPYLSGSWRQVDGWSKATPGQGYYPGYSSMVSYGAWFYGTNAFSSIAGTTCTSLTLHVSRPSSAGNAAAMPLHLLQHRNATRPGGAPAWAGHTEDRTGPAWGGNVNINLPDSWGQALINGTVKGLGLYYRASAHYQMLNSLAADSTCGRLTIGWT